MEEIDLKELLQIFWENKIRIFLITVLFIIIGIVYTMFYVYPIYESFTRLLLATNTPKSDSYSVSEDAITTTDITLNSNLVATYSELIKSNKILRTVISNLGLEENETQLMNTINVTAVSNTQVIKISVKNTNPVVAARIANEISAVFIETVKEYYGIENVHIVDEAEVSEIPYNINHLKDVAIFGLIGLVLSFAYVFIITMVDTRIKSTEEIETKFGLTVLATIPICVDGTFAKEGGKK